MAPMMWETLTTTCQPTATKTLATLLHPSSGILRHVHEFESISGLALPNSPDYLRLIILALPRDCLRRFYTEERVPLSIFQVLLYSQRKLTSLHLSVDHIISEDSGVSAVPHHIDSMRPLVSQVTSMTSKISTSPEAAARDKQHLLFMMTNALELKRLHLITSLDNYDDNEPQDPNNHWRFARSDLESLFPQDHWLSSLSKLEYMRLVRMDIGNGTEGLVRRLELAPLKHLEIANCHGVIELFDTLAKSPTACSGHLIHLVVDDRSVESSQETVESIRNFTKASSGLRSLEIHINEGLLLDKDSFSSHGNTLTSLILNNGPTLLPPVYTAVEIEHILAKYPKLQGLAVNLPGVDLGDIADLADNFHLRPCHAPTQTDATKLERILVSVRP
jgi:hypothetical protein